MPTAASTSAADGEDVRAIPWRQVRILLLVTFADAFASTFLFPIVPYMVGDFGVPSADVGFSAGLLASMFNLSKFVSNVWWGRLSDLIGRRPILLVGLCGTIVSSTMFGLSTNLPFALGARCLGGLLTANDAIGRASVRETVAEPHRGRIFALMGTAWGVGFFIGPVLGGVLSRPAATLPSLFSGTLFDAYPYLLACGASTLGAWISMAQIICGGFTETAGPHAKPIEDADVGTAPVETAMSTSASAPDGRVAEMGAHLSPPTSSSTELSKLDLAMSSIVVQSSALFTDLLTCLYLLTYLTQLCLP